MKICTAENKFDSSLFHSIAWSVKSKKFKIVRNAEYFFGLPTEAFPFLYTTPFETFQSR